MWGSILRTHLANGVCVRPDCSSIHHFLSRRFVLLRQHLLAWLLFSMKNASKPYDDGRRAQHWLLKKSIATPVLQHYLTTRRDFSVLKPQCMHHLAWFFTVIILIQPVKDVTAGVIWHCALTVDQRFNRYSDLYQSNDLVTGRHAFWKGKSGHTKYPRPFIIIMVGFLTKVHTAKTIPGTIR